MKNNKASSTAYTVLQGLMVIAAHPEYQHLVSSRNRAIGLHILRSSQEGRKRLKQITSTVGTACLRLLEKLMLPNISLHYGLRKAFIEHHVRAAVSDGATQVINLGAGFDTLLYRLAEESPELTCIEIDHPATHSVKAAALSDTEYKLANLHFLAVDFTHQTLAEELSSFSGFDAQRPTVCIVEGVLMYLTPEQIYHLFSSLVDLLHHPKRHLVFTALEPASSHPQSYGPLLKLYLRFKKEPLSWMCPEDHLGDFMEKTDFTLTRTANGEDFRADFVQHYAGPVHRGEYGAVAVSTSKK